MPVPAVQRCGVSMWTRGARRFSSASDGTPAGEDAVSGPAAAGWPPRPPGGSVNHDPDGDEGAARPPQRGDDRDPR
jgi:hypothetical protein